MHVRSWSKAAVPRSGLSLRSRSSWRVQTASNSASFGVADVTRSCTSSCSRGASAPTQSQSRWPLISYRWALDGKQVIGPPRQPSSGSAANQAARRRGGALGDRGRSPEPTGDRGRSPEPTGDRGRSTDLLDALAERREEEAERALIKEVGHGRGADRAQHGAEALSGEAALRFVNLDAGARARRAAVGAVDGVRRALGPRVPARGEGRRRSWKGRGYQRPSVVMSGHQRSSVVISGTRRHLAALSGTWRHSMALGGTRQHSGGTSKRTRRRPRGRSAAAAPRRGGGPR